jgi:O-antigen/teichoic acid export membrane protein
LLIAAIGAALSIVGNWLLIPLWGYHASAWMHLICYVVMIVITWRLGKTHYPIPYDLKKTGWYVLAAVGLFFLASFTTIENVPLNLLKNTVLLAIYIIYVERKEHFLKQILSR